MRDPAKILDAVSHLMSLGLSHVDATEAVRKIIAIVTPTPRSSLSPQMKREMERARKAAYRARTSRKLSPESHGTAGQGDIYLRESLLETEEVREKDISTRPMSRVGQRDKRDDWPTDYVELFWQAYPPQRRTEKAKVARKLALIRKSGNVTWANLMAGVERYARSGDVARGFAKGPMPWLNGGCWDDEVWDVKKPERPQRKPSLLTRLALGIDGEDHDARQADDHAGPTLDLRPVSHR